MGALRLTTSTVHLLETYLGKNIVPTVQPYPLPTNPLSEKEFVRRSSIAHLLPGAPAQTRTADAVGDAIDTDTGREQGSIPHVSESATSAPPDENTIHKPHPEEADIYHSRRLASEIVLQNHHFIHTATVLPSGRVDNNELSRTTSVADRPGVDKFGKGSATITVPLDRCANLGETCRKVRASSQPFSSQYIQTPGVNMEEKHKLTHTCER
ncbi:hypothetical protein MRX96_057143 [Rhipicephalus microplus]